MGLGYDTLNEFLIEESHLEFSSLTPREDCGEISMGL